jgi:FkbM family methyltransferase
MLRSVARTIYERRRFSLTNILKELPEGPRGVLHLGANFGGEAQIYEDHGIHRVVWVEGHPGYFARLSDHLKSFPKHEAHCLLISDRDDEVVTFRIANNTGSSTMFVPTESFGRVFPEIEFNEQLTLTTKRLDTYFRDKPTALVGCDFLVLDLEGAELKALIGMDTLLDQFRYILCEISVGRNVEGGPLVQAVESFLMKRGFVRRALWLGHSSADALYVRKDPTFLDIARSIVSCAWLRVGFESGAFRLRRAVIERVKSKLLLGQPES